MAVSTSVAAIGRVVVKVNGTAVHANETPTLTIPTSRHFSNRNFLFDIPGIQSASVSRIESFVVGGSASSSQLGVPQLLVTLQSANAADWIAWLNSSVASGWAASSEKTFTIDLMSNANSHLATIQGDGVGIVALRNVTTPVTNGVGKVEAELYVRHIHLVP